MTPKSEPKSLAAVKDGAVVAIYYTLHDEEGRPVESNKGGRPLVYLSGAGNIVKGLDQGLIGAKRGETRRVKVAPEDGYGTWDEKHLEDIPRNAFPPDADVVKGAVFHGQTPDGLPIQIRVHEVGEETVKVDKNHPLAGKTLDFEVYVYGVREATDEEREHKHAHGPGGHHHHH
ncbi:MAG: peptidylprolyl isomerase [Planctomycetota bacterium]